MKKNDNLETPKTKRNMFAAVANIATIGMYGIGKDILAIGVEIERRADVKIQEDWKK